MALRTALLGAAVAVVIGGVTGGTANAGQLNGWYVGLEGGADWLDEWSHIRNPAGQPAGASFEVGWTVLATVGYGFFSNWRAEFEAGFRSNDIDTYTRNGALFAYTGDVWEASLMGNLLYDIHLSDRIALSFGAGVGGDFAEITLFQASPVERTDDDWNLAYQGIAGLSWALNNRTDLTLSYRYFRVHEADFDFRPATNLILNGDDFVKHTATIGIRYALQSAPVYVETEQPPPPPGPMAPPPRQFIVFFGFNKYTLTSEAMRVISEAVVAVKDTGSATILITGHTDTVGSHRYNERLSMRRANVVKGEMVRQGVSTAAITSIGKGETELLVQTADGVKEPQNRRSTIDLN